MGTRQRAPSTWTTTQPPRSCPRCSTPCCPILRRALRQPLQSSPLRPRGPGSGGAGARRSGAPPRRQPRGDHLHLGGTESNNLAISGTTQGTVGAGHVVTSVIEHPAVLRPCEMLERQGHGVTRLGVDRLGVVDVEEAREAVAAWNASPHRHARQQRDRNDSADQGAGGDCEAARMRWSTPTPPNRWARSRSMSMTWRRPSLASPDTSSTRPRALEPCTCDGGRSLPR